MQLGIESQIPDGLLAANALLAENSRQGGPTSTQALYPGFEFAISSTYKGFQFWCSESASDPVVAPSKVGCSTVLPNGKTVGQYINQGRAQLQASVNAGGAFNGDILLTFASIARDYGQIDFKNGAGGNSVLANRATLGQAGNFAYYAIGSGYLSPTTLDLGASLYSHASVLLGKKSLSSLTGPLGIDASAASVRNAALATPGCPQ